jgi:ubiquinone/menaquinone biosynthesis C-methylase UbiE
MEGPGETARLRLKTEAVLVDHHLHWAGLRPGESFVDIGCGPGDVLLAAAERAAPAPVIGVDANADRLDAVLRRAWRDRHANVRVQAATLTGLGSTGLPDDAHDHTWTRFFLEYQADPTAIVREMARITRPGGSVTLIDVEGHGVYNHRLPPDLDAARREVMADLRTTGFDPMVGRDLPAIARRAGLTAIRHDIEPHHRIVGRPDARTAELWRRKLDGLRHNYLLRFPGKTGLAWVFAAYLDFLAREDTMTWSLLHLVQGVVPRVR